jgi:hypothetical protein
MPAAGFTRAPMSQRADALDAPSVTTVRARASLRPAGTLEARRMRPNTNLADARASIFASPHIDTRD